MSRSRRSQTYYAGINIIFLITRVFKKLCYKRLPLHHDKICFADLVYTRSYFINHRHVKFRTNNNIVIDIHRSANRIHWSIFEDEKKERIEIGDVNFHQKLCCVIKFAPKGRLGKTT